MRHPEAHLVLDLACVLGVAGITSVLARLVRQPTILGYLLAGLIVGPYIPIPIFADPTRVQAMAELGVVLVMFAIGVEFRIAKLVKVIPTSGFTGLIQMCFLLWCGFTLGKLLGWTNVEGAFLGASIAISSTMVVTKVFVERPVADDIREHILGVLVIQDVGAIALIAAMTATVAGGGLSVGQLATTLGQLAAVLAGLLVGGILVIPRLMRFVLRMASTEITVVFAVGICFSLALLADYLGYSVALGAFIAGILVAESGKGDEVEHLVEPLRDVFAAIFFVSIGMTVDPRLVFANLPMSLAVFSVVVIAQLVSVSFAGVLSGNGLRKSITAGLALGQIGEFAFILAAIGISAGAVRSSLQPILVTVAVLTAFTTPIFLSAADRVVSVVDRLLPRRLRLLLGMYEEWFERLKTQPANERPPIRRALRAIVVDGVGLIFLLAIAAIGGRVLLEWLVGRFAISGTVARIVFTLAILAVSVPLVLALWRNTAALARLVSEQVAGSASQGVRGARLMVYSLVALAVGLPALAVLRSLTETPYVLIGLAAVAIGIGVYVWRNASELDAELSSGAEQIAGVLARASAGADEARLSHPTLITGLDTVFGLRVKDGAYAIGKSLAELNMRALTGTTVVAIHRKDAQVVLPTGHERIAEGDILALTGTKSAIDKAVKLVHEGNPPASTSVAHQAPT